MRTISGHPSVELDHGDGRTSQITVCGNCERVRTILMLTGDRWYCTACRSTGATQPTMIPVRRPGRK